MASTSSTSATRSRHIHLPKFDGYLEAGIAAEVDSTLPDADKLPVYGKTAEDIYNNALAWAWGKDFRNDVTNTLFLSGIAVITGCGLLRSKHEDGTPDGDWYEANNALEISDDAVSRIEDLLTKENVSTAITVICATKVNYWLMNHHVGQTGERNVAAGYVQKVLTLKFGALLPQGIVQATHMLGHYTSTRYVLEVAGIPNILPAFPRATNVIYELKFSDDARLRFNAPPAGTHRMAVCFEAARDFPNTNMRTTAPACPTSPPFPSGRIQSWKTQLSITLVLCA
jgi:hypothetical protein